MCKRLIVFVLVLGLASGAYGGLWTGAVSSEWSNDDNWLGGESSAEKPSGVMINSNQGNWPEITESGEICPCRSYLQGDAILTIRSGDLSIHEKFFVGGRSHGNGPGTIDMYGGKLIVEDYGFPVCAESGPRLSVSDEEPGTINMYDGEIIVKTFIAWPDGSGEGKINMYGGVFWTDEVSWKDKESCVMTFYSSEKYPHGGTFIVDGNSAYPQPDCDMCDSIWEKWYRGQVVTAIPGDRVSIEYDPVKNETIVKSVPIPLGDINRDGIVDWDDLAMLVEQWLDRCRVDEWCGGRDIDQSSRVDFDDFALFASSWLETWP